MLFDFNFYSALLLLFFSNGILYSLLLLKKGILNDNQSNKWLSLFVFLCALYIAPWMLGFAGWYDHQPYREIMFCLPLQHLFFIGPIIYFYVQSLLNPSFKLNKTNFYHLIPAILYLFYNIIMIVTDKLILNKPYFFADGSDRDFDDWYQKLGLISMLVYFVLSLIYYQKYQKLVQQLVSFADDILFKWIKTFLIAFLSMQILQILFYIIDIIAPSDNKYIGSWWYFFCFSIIMLYIAITGYSNALTTKISFQFDSLKNNKVFLLASSENEITTEIDFQELPISFAISSETFEWKNKISTLFETQNVSQNPELTLTDVAKSLNTNVSIISKTINQGFQMNFNDFVNQYRVEEVKKAFQKNQHKKSTLLGIAFDCGFNSKATFNRAFKKNTSLSPKDYLSQL